MERFKPVLDCIERYYPEWFRWYAGLSEKNCAQLRMRMANEQEDFIDKGMWEYQEYIVWEHANQKAIYARRTAKLAAEIENGMLAATNSNYIKQYGYDVFRKIEISKTASNGPGKSF